MILRQSILRTSSSLLQYRHLAKKGKKQGGKGPSYEAYKHFDKVFNLKAYNSQLLEKVDEMKVTYATAITTQFNPMLLGNVKVKIDGTSVTVAEVATIKAEPGQPVIVDCSLFPEYTKAIKDAIVKGVKLEVQVKNESELQVALPKLTGDLKKALVDKAKVEAQRTLDELRRIRDKADKSMNSADRSIRLTDTQFKIKEFIHQIYLDNAAIATELRKQKCDDLEGKPSGNTRKKKSGF